MSDRFTPQVERALLRAGWYSGRRRSEEEMAHLHQMRPLFAAAEQFLREFDGLYLDRTCHPSSPGMTSSFCIDAVATWQGFDSNEDLDEYEEDYGCRIYPIGILGYQISSLKNGQRYVTGYDHLLLDEQARVFAVRYKSILIGVGIESVIHNLVMAQGWRGWNEETGIISDKST